MNDETTKVVLVDDQTLYRESLRMLMEHWPEFSVVGDASNGKESVELCPKIAPDLVLMDVQMPIMNGIEAAIAIHRTLPQTTIVMLTVATDDDLVFDALKTGIKGYLLKDTPARQLRDRLHRVLQGETTISDSVTAAVVGELNRLRTASPVRHPESHAVHLSDREVEILRLVAQGLSNEEIGARLYLSAGTVKKQLSALMQRLYLDNRVQAAVYAVRVGLVE